MAKIQWEEGKHGVDDRSVDKYVMYGYGYSDCDGNDTEDEYYLYAKVDGTYTLYYHGTPRTEKNWATMEEAKAFAQKVEDNRKTIDRSKL